MRKLVHIIQSFVKRVSERPFMKKIIKVFKDKKIMPKLTCLLLAGVLWVYVDARRINEAHFRILMQVDLPREFAVADIEKKYLTVTAKGSTDDLRNVLPAHINVIVKIQNPRLGGATRYPVTVLATNLPDTVTLSPEDKTVFVTIEKRTSRKVPVLAVTEGTLDSRFTMGNIRLTPDETEISGASSVISKIYSVKTDPILLSGHAETFQHQVKLDLEDLKYCDIAHKTVDALIPLFDVKGIAQIITVPQIRNTSDDAEYALLNKNIRLLVRNEKEEPVSPDDFDVWVEVPAIDSSVQPGENTLFSLPVTIRPKTGKSVVAVVPEKIQIKARKK